MRRRGTLRDRLLRRSLRLSLDRPRAVIGASLVVTVACAALIPGLYVDAGHTKMSDPEDPHIVRLHEFLEDFGSPNALVLMVRGDTRERRRQLVDRLVTELPAPKSSLGAPCLPDAGAHAPGCVADVLGRIDIDAIANHAMLYLSLDEVDDVVHALEDEALGAEALVGVHGLTSMFETFEGGVEASAEGDLPTGEARADALRGVVGIARLFDELRARVEDPQTLRASLTEAVLGKEDIASDAIRGIDPQGYLSSGDHTIQIALVQPLADSDDPLVVTPFVDYVATHAGRLAAELRRPCASAVECPEGPLRVDLTGLPAVVADESRTLATDIALTSLIAFIGIALLFAIGFRSLPLALLGLGPLLLALVWDLAFVRQAFGYLNIVTSSFMAVFMGLGIDFSVHLLARYQEARRAGADERAAASEAVLSAGPGILTGGLTTAGAFLALTTVEFKAFAEMGLMSGVGIALALIATLLILPAALVLPGLRGLQGKVAVPRRRREEHHRGVPELVVSHPWVFLGVGVTIAAIMGYHGGHNSFNYDYMSLLPADLPSTRAWVDLTEHTDYSPEVCAVVADSLEEAERLAQQLEEQETIERVEVITAYLPEDQAPKAAKLRQLAPLLPAVERDLFEPDPVDVPAILAALQSYIDTLDDLRFEAVRANADDGELFDPLRRSAHDLHTAIGALDARTAQDHLGRLQVSLLDLRRRGLAVLRQAATGETLSVETLLARLPTALSERLHSDGRFAVYAYPTRPIQDGEYLERLVSEVRAVSPTATGFPVNHWEFLHSIEIGFREASLVTLLAVFLLIFLDFRRLLPTLLSLAPLAMGILWTVGTMMFLGIQYNGANVIGYPLLVGIGVDAGVHIIHRHHQEAGGDVAAVVRHTGRAVLLATGTTMIGFGSLALASHRGMSTLGQLLLVGMGACLLTATLFLPALLELLRRSRAARSA